MDGPPPPEEDFSTLPVTDRLQHKNWKARVSGYETLIKSFQTSASDTDPVFRPYLANPDLLKRIVSDANAVAQERGVEVIVNLVKFSGENASRTRESVLPVLVEKCLGSTRSGTKNHAIELILQYVEVSNTGADVVAEVLSGLNSKQPKIVAGSVSALKEVVRSFGIGVVPPAPILKSVPKMFAHTDKAVRTEAMQLVQTLYRGMGPAIEPFLGELKPVQVKEINDAFENMDKEGIGKGSLKPERETREQQRKGPEESTDLNAVESSPELTPPDPRQFAEEVDIGPKLPSGFTEAIASSKWKERKEALDELYALLSKALRIKDVPELGPVIKALASRMADANINCVITAATCIDAMARGLQNSFAKYGEVVVPPMLERLKERKQTVTDAIGSALDAVFTTVAIGDVLDWISPALSSKNPQVKEGTLKFLHRSLTSTTAPPPPSQIKPLSESLASLLSDSYEAARNEAAICLGTLMKIVGERPLNALMDTIEDVRKVKVKEAYENATVRCKTGGPPTRQQPGLSTAPKKQPAAKVEAPPVLENPSITAEPTPETLPKVAKGPPARLLSKKPTSTTTESGLPSDPQKVPPPIKKPPAASAANASKSAKAPAPAPTSVDVKYKHSAEEASSLAAELIPPSIATDLSDANWKTRLAALEEFAVWLEGCVESVDSEVVVRFLAKKGWSEKNFQVSAKLYSVLSLLAERCSSFSRSSVALAVPHLSEKLGDMKLKKPAGDTLLLFAEKTSLSFVLSQAYEPLGKQKAPKVLADSIAWVEQAVTEFGIAGLSLRALIDFLKLCLKNSNAAVRSNATKALVTVKLFAGGGIKDLLEDLNPQLLSTIEKEFESADGMPTPIPTRTCLEIAVTAEAGGKRQATSGDPLDELFPRVDIDRLVAGTSILAEIKSDAWKNRKEALETLQSILDVGSNKRLKPSMGDIGQALKARVGDTNKACQILALDILSRIANGMNKPFERYARLYIAPIAMVLSDQKPNIRAAATKTLSDFAIACEGMEPLVGSIATGLESQNPLQRSSLLSWIAEWLSTHPPSATLDLSPWVSSVVACLDDRSADVRKAAQAVLPHLIRSVGFDRVVQETGSLKPATRAAIMPLIQAARPEAGEQPSGPKPQRPKSPPPQTQIPAEAGPGPSRPTGLRNKKLNVTGDASTKPELPRAGSRAGPTSASGSVASTPNPPASPTADTRIFMASSTEAKKARLLKDSGKWIIEAAPVRKDLLELLHHQMEGHVARSVLSLLFSTDHNAVNDYMAGMTQLSNCFTDATSKMDESVSLALVSNCDLVLKYACTKVHESQPNLISRSLELLHSVVDFLRNVDYQLSDGEAQLFIPTIIHKLGDPREAVRSRVQQLIQLLPRIYAFSRIFQLLLEHGLKSKVSKTRQGSLEELASVLKRSGVGVCDPTKAFPLLAAMISDKDPSVRKSALSVLSEAYVQTGDKIWAYIGRISAKDRTQLEERLRRVPSTSTAGKELTNPLVAKVAAATPRPASPSRQLNGLRPASPAVNSVGTMEQPPPAIQGRAASPSQILSKNSALPTMAGPSGLRKSHLPSRLARGPAAAGIPKPAVDASASDQGRRALKPLNLGTLVPPAVALPTAPDKPDSGRSQSPTGEDISLVISSILSNDANRSVEALKKIQKGLEASNANSEMPETFQGLAEHSEGLIGTITVQVSHVFDRVEDLAEPSNFRLAKHLMQTLHSFFSHAVLAESLTVDTITSLLEELTLRLLQTDESPDANVKEISRFINLILLKVFASGKRIAVFRSLFSLLLKIVKPFPSNRTTPDSQEAKVAELVLKCIWKLARNLPSDLDKQLLDPAEFFPAIERCLQAIPPNDWRARATNKVPCGDMPLRTIKVIIQHVVAKHGDQVYDFLSSAFDDPSATIVYPYVYRILNSANRQDVEDDHSRGTTAQETGSLTSVEQHHGVRERSSSTTSIARRSSESPRENEHRSLPSSSLDDSDPDVQLLHIIGNISSESTGALHKEGITQLYQFLKTYPHKKAKVDKMLESTGPAFRKYLARALASRAAEDEEREAAVADTLSRLEAVRKEPISPSRTSTMSPKRMSGASEGTGGDSEKLSRLHSLFQYRGSDGGLSRGSGEIGPGKATNGH